MQVEMSKEELQKKIDELKRELSPLEELEREMYRREVEETEAKVKRSLKKEFSFDDEDLIYSAYARCTCGAGYAYPKKIGIHGAWHCSAILTGKAEAGSAHDGELPFSFYEIKSEQQPSAKNATTRPKKG
jgi:hypothetical protein